MKVLRKMAVGACLLSLFSLFTVQAWAISLDFSPSSSTIGIGESFTVDLVISGLTNDNVSGFDFLLGYDSSIVSFDSYVFGNELGDLILFDASDYSVGDNLVEVSWLSDFDTQPDAFTLVSLVFTGLNLGTSNLGVSGLILSDDGWPAQSIMATVGGGSIAVAAPVPEPTTMLLFGTGMAGLLGSRIRRKKK